MLVDQTPHGIASALDCRALGDAQAMMPFTKLFGSIVTSSIWRESTETKVVWVTMLALANQHGEVWASVGGLAHTAGVTREQCADALRVLLSPDPDSRTKDHEGRRIEEIDGGWMLLNYLKYRYMRDEEARKEYMREYMRDRRSVNSCKHPLTQVSNVNIRKPQLAKAEAEAEAEADKKKDNTNTTRDETQAKPAKVSSRVRHQPVSANPPTLAEVASYVQEYNGDIPADEFLDANTRSGWTYGNGKKPVLDWKAHYRTWQRGRDKRREAEAPPAHIPTQEQIDIALGRLP
jgi:hypothetical protein